MMAANDPKPLITYLSYSKGAFTQEGDNLGNILVLIHCRQVKVNICTLVWAKMGSLVSVKIPIKNRKEVCFTG